MLSLQTNLSLLLLLIAVVAAQDLGDAGGIIDTLLSMVEPITQSFQKAQEECGAEGISGCTIMTTLREVAFTVVGSFLGGGDGDAADTTTTMDVGTATDGGTV